LCNNNIHNMTLLLITIYLLNGVIYGIVQLSEFDMAFDIKTAFKQMVIFIISVLGWPVLCIIDKK
jgi:hypothetical protein